jgi:RNA polymerase sigma factor (sigma-70 family)
MSVVYFWKQYIEGDNQILGELYRPMFRKLFFVAFKYTQNEDTSFDLVQDLFTTLLHTPVTERTDKWKDIQNVEGFLVVLIKCKALDRLKVTRNRTRILNEKHLKESPFQTDSINDDLEQLDKIISMLTTKEQTIIRLHLEGYKNAEIAEEQNISEKSIRNRLSESRNKIKLLWKRSYIFIVILNWIN